MTDSLWNKYYVFSMSLEVSVTRSPNWWGRRGHLNWRHRVIAYNYVGLENVRVGKARLFRLVNNWQRSLVRRRQYDYYYTWVTAISFCIQYLPPPRWRYTAAYCSSTLYIAFAAASRGKLTYACKILCRDTSRNCRNAQHTGTIISTFSHFNSLLSITSTWQLGLWSVPWRHCTSFIIIPIFK